MVASGFVQSLEFLKKSWNSPNNFQDLEKVWRIETKSGKNGKKPWVFFLFFLQSYNKCLSDFSLRLGQTICLQRTTKKSLFLRFLRSLLITYLITVSLEILLSGKSLEFWIQRSVRTLWLLILKNFFKEQIYGPEYYVS